MLIYFFIHKSLVLSLLENSTPEEVLSDLSGCSEELRDDPEIILTAVKTCIIALGHASNRLKDDPEFMLPLMKQNNRSTQYASNRLKEQTGHWQGLYTHFSTQNHGSNAPKPGLHKTTDCGFKFK